MTTNYKRGMKASEYLSNDDINYILSCKDTDLHVSRELEIGRGSVVSIRREFNYNYSHIKLKSIPIDPCLTYYERLIFTSNDIFKCLEIHES